MKIMQIMYNKNKDAKWKRNKYDEFVNTVDNYETKEYLATL